MNKINTFKKQEKKKQIQMKYKIHSISKICKDKR